MTTRAVEAAPSALRRVTLVDYVRLTKPRIVALLLLTTVAAMFAAAGGMPDGMTLLATAVGGYLAAGGANAINHFVDRDIDTRMGRTHARPVATGRVPASHALVFGIALGIASGLELGLAVNWLAAALAMAGLLIYVGVYTLWLKRSSVHNIVVGGAAGAVPPLVGWAAATGELSIGAWLLFAIVFYWTPPHFWALALLLRRDYAAAGVPMLPVVRGVAATKSQILYWTAVMVGVSLLPAAAGTAGPEYLVAAIALGLPFLAGAALLARESGLRWARPLFHYSLLYLALLFAALAIWPG